MSVCECWTKFDYQNPPLCGARASFALVTRDGEVLGLLCAKHCDDSDGCARELREHFVRERRQERGVWNGETPIVSLYCDACRQRLPMDRYPGQKCPECMRATMVVGASEKQTAAIESLRATMERREQEKPVAKELAPPPKPALRATLEADATDAAWRMAGSQFVKLAKEPLVALLSRHLGPGDDSLRARIATFLDTELGAALLSGVLSAGLSALPLPAGDVSQRLARELRVKAMAGAGDVVADVVTGPLREVASMYLRGEPPCPAELPDGSNAPVSAAEVLGGATQNAPRAAAVAAKKRGRR